MPVIAMGSAFRGNMPLEKAAAKLWEASRIIADIDAGRIEPSPLKTRLAYSTLLALEDHPNPLINKRALAANLRFEINRPLKPLDSLPGLEYAPNVGNDSDDKPPPRRA